MSWTNERIQSAVCGFAAPSARDERIIEQFTLLRDEYEARIAELEQKLVKAEEKFNASQWELAELSGWV